MIDFRTNTELSNVSFTKYNPGPSPDASQTRDFDLTEENINMLSQDNYQGSIEYYVKNIERMGSLDIELNGRQLNPPVPNKGWNKVTFSENEATQGSNSIKFSGKGEFNIDEVRVYIETV